MARSAAVDPLEKFRFVVSWTDQGDSEATTLARMGFTDIQMPKKSTNAGSYREGIDPDISQRFAGLTSMEDVTMSRGILIDDQNNELYKWMSAVHNPTTGHKPREALVAREPDAASNKYRKDVTITMLDREGNAARKWTLYQAFPINFVPGGDLDAGEDGEKSLESLTLAYEDFREELLDSADPKAVSPSLPA